MGLYGGTGGMLPKFDTTLLSEYLIGKYSDRAECKWGEIFVAFFLLAY